MNFFNRAIKNVTRKLSKSVLLLITFFVIGNFVIIGLGVSNASTDAKTLTRKKMRAVVQYSIDYHEVDKYIAGLEDEDEINEFYEHYPRITLEDVKEVVKDERVKTANTLMNNNFYSVDGGIEYVKLGNKVEEEIENQSNNTTSCYLDENGQEICESYQYVQPVFGIRSNMFPDMIEFDDGTYTIVEGRFYNQEEIDNAEAVVVVSKALAELNGLHIGDTITIATNNANDRWLKQQLEEIGYEGDFNLELEVVGIYDSKIKVTPDNQNFDWIQPNENVDNFLLIPGSTVIASTIEYEQASWDYYASQNPDDEYFQDESHRPSIENNASAYISDATILLNDPLEVDQFVEDYNASLGQFKKLDANNEEFERLSRPLDTLSLFSNFIVWLVVINAIVIITLVTALTLKTREYEIGVLLSLGASKLKIVAQFFVELSIVAILGFTLSIMSGSVVASKVGENILDYQIASSGVEDKEEDPWGNDYYDQLWNPDYTTEISLEDLVAEYHVSVSPLIIGEIYVVGLGIVLVSILIPSMMIMRFNPKKILMNQN